MALDSRLALQAQGPKTFDALQQGLRAERTMRNAPILEELQRQQVQRGQFELQQAPIIAQQQQQQFQSQMGRQEVQYEQEMLQRRAQVMSNIATQALSLDPSQREAFKQTLDPAALQSVGINPQEAMQFPTDDASLQNLAASSRSFLSGNQNLSHIQSSKILEDGATVQVLSGGDTRVTDPEGNIVTGAERSNALADARAAGIEAQGDRSRARTAAKLAAELESIPATERVKYLSENRANFSSDISESENIIDEIDQAISIWENASGTISGPFASRTPNLSDDSQELESILVGLGIDRLASFKGATSEKELAAAFRAGASIEQDAKTGIRRLQKQRRDLERNVNRMKGLKRESINLMSKQPKGGAAEVVETPPPQGQVFNFDAQGNLIQ